MKTLKEEITENTKSIEHDCGCCTDECIEITLLFKILKERGIDYEL